MGGQTLQAKSQEWAVYLNGKYLDSVYFDVDCCRDYVKLALVNHEGYNPAIEVEAHK